MSKLSRRLCLLAPAAAWAAPDGPPLVRVASFGVTPYVLDRPEAPVRGALVDFCDAQLAPRWGVRLQWLPVMTVPRVLRSLQDGTADFCPILTRCPERELQLRFAARSQMGFESVIALRADHPLAGRPRLQAQDLIGLRVGWVQGSPVPAVLETVRIRWDLGSCRALGMPRVRAGKGSRLGGRAQPYRASGKGGQRRIGPFPARTLRAGQPGPAMRRCRLVVGTRHTPRQRLAWPALAAQRGACPEPDSFLASVLNWERAILTKLARGQIDAGYFSNPATPAWHIRASAEPLVLVPLDAPPRPLYAAFAPSFDPTLRARYEMAAQEAFAGQAFEQHLQRWLQASFPLPSSGASP